MKLGSARKSQRGVVLIVVVGVLAILSLLAATFGMIARLELAVSRNQTEHEMAREAAHNGAESLLNALQSWLNGGAMTSGALPTFLPNAADTDGVLLYRRDGVKVYMAVNDTVPQGSMTPDWLQGLGLQDYGMFNLNAMGFTNDLGSNCNPDIRYTSFDCSLVRLLASRFASIATAPINANDMANIQVYYPLFNTANEQQRVAIFLSRAIINWRYGPAPSATPPYNVPVPGAPGTEERRLGHLPRWNSKAPWSSTFAPPWPQSWPIWQDTGVGYPAAPGWGSGDGLPSRYINNTTNVLGPMPWSYAEPSVWSAFQGAGSTNAPWGNPLGNDQGLPYPGLFWGKVASYATPILTADNTQPGWRDWIGSEWINNGTYYVYFATGPARWWSAQISASTSNTLTLKNYSTVLPSQLPLPPPTGYPYTPSSFPNPNAGDSFCIFMPWAYAGQLRDRWSSTDPNPEGDLVPNAMLWPDRSLSTEGNVWDLMVDDNILQNSAEWGKLAANNGTVTSPPTGPTDPTLTDSTKQWNPGALAGYVVHLYAGPGRGQVRTIQGNTSNQLTIYNPVTGQPAYWDANDLPNVTTQYRIEYPDDNLPSKFQPNNLQGNNRLYLSLGDLYASVVVPAFVNDGLSATNAQAVANILMPYFLPYLTVSTQAIQASQSLCSINDWAVDGVDNNADGVVDDPGEAGYEPTSTTDNYANERQVLAQKLYNGLDLYAWAHAGAATVNPTRVQQAAQLVASIIDFRDPNDVPTLLTNGSLNETATAIPPFTVYGAKGLHVTQIMPSPDPTYSSTGIEMTQNDNGGNNAGHDWAWNAAGYWYYIDVAGGGPPPLGTPVATFSFNVPPGFYALRLIGGPSGSTFYITYGNPTPYGVTLNYNDPGGNSSWSTGFVRKAVPGPLVCFNALGGNVTFQLQGPSNAEFRGIALLPQYVQLTNISAHDINMTNWTLTTDQVGLPTNSLTPITLPASYPRAADGTVLDLRRIAGASTNGVYPIKYGTYVVCMCEEAYEKQWTAHSTINGWPPPTDSDFISGINGDGLWGNAPNEAYPIFPAGDISDNNALALLLGAVNEATATRAPSVLVKDTINNIIAGAPVDGAIPTNTDPFPLPPVAQIPSLKCYSSIEKRMILQPTWDTKTFYWDWYVYQPSPPALSGSQNRLVTEPTDPRIPTAAGGSQFRTCLNKDYTKGPVGTWGPPIWDVGSTDANPLLATPTSMAQNNQMFPLILNRPYPTTGWLGLVPTSNTDTINVNTGNPSVLGSWRTIDPNPNLPVITGIPPNATAQLTPPATPEQLLGTLMSNATVGGVYARFNINTAPEGVLDSIFRSRYVDSGGPSATVTASAGTNTLTDTSKGAWPTPNGLANMVVFVDSGTGNGQTRMIIANTGSQLTLNRNWDTSLDSTSVYRIMDSESGLIICAREQRAIGANPYPNLAFPTAPTVPPALAKGSWTNWDELLNDPLFQYSSNAANLRLATPTGLVNGIGFYDAPESSGTNVSNADAGAGTYADGFPDSSNEKKEWFMRFANLFSMQSTSFQFTVAGLVYKDQPWDSTAMQNNEPVAIVRIEMDVDLSNPQAGPSIVHFRYLTQQ